MMSPPGIGRDIDTSSGGAHMSALGVISTDDVRPREKLGLWQDSLWQLCGRLRSDTQTDGSFWGKIEYASIGDVRIAKLTASRHRVVRTPNYARRDNDGFLKVALQMKGMSCFEQGGRKVVLSPNEWSIYDTTRPYTVTVPQDTEMLVVMVPRDNLSTQRLHLEDLMVRKFPGRVGMGRLAYQFMISAFDEIPIITPEAEWEIAGAISHLIRLTMLDASEVQNEVSLREVWRDRIKAYIGAHLRDPELSIDRIAGAMNCTKRYVHKVFQSEGASVSESILRMRLTRCREDLRNPARSRNSITEIAYSWGFNNPAHFSRAFKDEFNVSPRFFRMETQLACVPQRKPGARRSALAGRLLKLREGQISSYS
jgi:AraC-like DNA-binding protein